MNTDTLVLLQCIMYVLFLDDNADEECEQFSNGKSSAGCCLAIA